MRDIVSTKPRVLFVHDRFGAYAGAEVNILATAVGLEERGCTTAILHGIPTGKGEETWRAVFRHRFPLPGGQHLGNAVAAVTEFQPDVIYIHHLADLPLIELLLASGLPLVRMVHDHTLYCMRSYKYNYFTRRICRRALSPFCLFPCGAFVTRNPEGGLPVKWVSYSAKLRELELNRLFNLVLVASQFMKDELVRNGFAPEKIEIHPPVPPTTHVEATASFSDRNLIVYSGQITRGKGVDVLLESLAQMTTPFECLIFGDGNHREYCENLCRRLGLASRVHFKGYVSPDEIARHYCDSSVVAMSSVWPEPFGAAGLEGMRFGLPVVAFDAGGIREWLTDGANGYLVPWMDRTLYAARIQKLLENKSLAREMGERGRRTISECFSFSNYVDGLEHLFTRLVARCGRTALT